MAQAAARISTDPCISYGRKWPTKSWLRIFWRTESWLNGENPRQNLELCTKRILTRRCYRPCWPQESRRIRVTRCGEKRRKHPEIQGWRFHWEMGCETRADIRKKPKASCTPGPLRREMISSWFTIEIT